MKFVINPIRPALCEAAQDFYLLVRLQSQPEAGFKRTPLKLALVIDRSGSMPTRARPRVGACLRLPWGPNAWLAAYADA